MRLFLIAPVELDDEPMLNIFPVLAGLGANIFCVDWSVELNVGKAPLVKLKDALFEDEKSKLDETFADSKILFFAIVVSTALKGFTVDAPKPKIPL